MFYVLRPDGTRLETAPGVDRVSALWNAVEADPWLARHMKRNGSGNLSGAQRKGYRVLAEEDLPEVTP